MCSFARNEHNLLTPNGLPCQVKQLVQKLEALESDVAEHEARQQVELTTVKEELETERVLRAQVQELRQETTADKEKAEERAKEIQGRLSEIEGERVRIGRERDIAAGAVYLASAASSYVTGRVLDIDGGIRHSNLEMGIPDLG